MRKGRASILVNCMTCGVLCCLAIAFGSEEAPAHSQEDLLVVYPSFSSALDSPKFVMVLSNAQPGPPLGRGHRLLQSARRAAAVDDLDLDITTLGG